MICLMANQSRNWIASVEIISFKWLKARKLLLFLISTNNCGFKQEIKLKYSNPCIITRNIND